MWVLYIQHLASNDRTLNRNRCLHIMRFHFNRHKNKSSEIKYGIFAPKRLEAYKFIRLALRTNPIALIMAVKCNHPFQQVKSKSHHKPSTPAVDS